MLIFLSWQAMKRGHQGHFSLGPGSPTGSCSSASARHSPKNEAYSHVLLPPENFEKLLSGDDEASLKNGLKSWCVVKLE